LPTKVDIIAVNVFDAPLDSKVVRVKIKFYLGKFAAYFVAIFIVLSVADYSKVGKRTIMMLHDSAFASKVYIPTQTPGSSHKKQRSKQSKEVFSKLKKKDSEIREVIDLQNRFNDMSVDRRSSSADVDHKAMMSRKMLQSNRLLMKDIRYAEGFYAYIDQRRTYIGCEPLLYPDGIMEVCNHVVVSTDKGVLEDFVIFVCNNHSLLNCVFAVDGAPVDRFGNKLIYITQSCIAFFMSAVSGSIFAYFTVSANANIAFDIVVTTPATIFIAKLIKVLYTCPVNFSVDYQVENPMIVRAIQVLGKLALIPIMVSIVALLILATMFSRGYDYVMIMTYFFLQVQLYGFFLELFLATLMFTSRFYMRCTIDLYLRSIIIVEVGRRYTELIYHGGLSEGKDYHYRCYYLFFMLRIECIYRFDDAIKKGYVTEEDRIPDDVELTEHSTTYNVNGENNDDKDPEDTLYLSYDTYGGNDEVPELYVEKRNSAMVSNPLHSNNNKTSIDVASRNTARPVQEIDDESTIQGESNTAARSAENEDEADDEVFDYADSGEGSALRRKQFKPETRSSFVEIYRKFEESEQITPTLSSTGSEKRTDFLHHSLNKNNTNSLAFKR